MCGINGCNWNDVALVKRMNNAIKHRGPNDRGAEAKDGVTLGQVRLSIIDLSPAGHQPMYYDKRNGTSSATHRKTAMKKTKLGITFNGEIYNYLELKKELQTKGYTFSTKCDTEVILAAYAEWGTNCVKRFNGMWAFVLHDAKKGILFCSRDRLGQKPFHYYWNNGQFLFSSELKGLIAHSKLKINKKSNLDPTSINLYFALGFIPAPRTIYKNVQKLEAAHNLILDLKKKKITIKRYWNLPAYRPINDKKKLVAQGRKLFKDATRLRMIADVPVGAFLSGGLDSSATVGEMRELTDASKLHTFSIGFDGKYDETKYINIVKNYFGTVHHHQYFKEPDFKKLLKTYALVYDEPFGDFSGFPTYKVSKMAREQVTVCLSGDGGDEIFGGYSMHITGYRMDIIRKFPRVFRWIGSKIPAKKRIGGFASLYLLKQACKLSLERPEEFYAKALEDDTIKSPVYNEWTTKSLKQALIKGGGLMSEALRIHDLMGNTLADHFLVKVDRASMAHALEVRSPFLDYRMAEYAQRIPTKWQASSFESKRLLKGIIKGIVPKAIVTRSKQGFTPPLEKWILKKQYEPLIEEANKQLSSINEELATLFKEKFLKNNDRLSINYKIRLFLFGLWWKQWVKE